MPEVTRKVRTYEQLDRMLCKRPTRGSFLVSTNVYGKVNASADFTNSSPEIVLKYVAQGGHYYFEVARVWRVSGGDTVYRVSGCRAEIRKEAIGRKRYRKYVQRLTPRDITGRTPREHDVRWYRIRDGVATQIEGPPKGRPFCWTSLPQCITPSLKEWLASHGTLPKFVARSRAFAINLRRGLADGLPCQVQLLTHRQAPAGGLSSKTSSLWLHVCTPPTGTSNGRRLVIETFTHSQESRTHFHVDGDYGMRHSQFAALEPKGPHGWRVVDRWPCARDAIAGIKEWVLSTVYIPGPM